jgi:DNA sulfur modification protein DndD
MIIKSISIENFKSYYGGNNKFEFSEGLNIISGHEGSGKSNLFDAFMWVLFNRISGMKKDERLAEDNVKYINDRIKNEYFIKKSEDKIRCSVKLDVILPHENNKHYEIIKEKMIFLKNNHSGNSIFDRNVWVYENTELIVRWTDENYNEKEKYNENAKTELDRIFPEKIRKYIWFQGEQLNELLDFENEDTLKKAIQYISYLSVYGNMKTVIKETHRLLGVKVRNKISANNRDAKKYNKLSAELLEAETELQKNKELRTNWEKEYNNLEESEKDQNEKLTILAGFPELKSREGLLMGKVEDLKNQVSNLGNQEISSFVKRWMLKGTDKLLSTAADELAKFEKYRLGLAAKNKKQFSEGVPGDTLIREILKLKKCTICGREVILDSDEYKLIESHLDKNKKMKILDPEIENLHGKVMNLKGKPAQLIYQIKNIDQEILTHKQTIREKQIERNRNTKELSDVREKIKDLVREKGHDLYNLNAENINSTLSRIRSDKEKLKRKIDTSNRDIILGESKITRINSEIRGLKNPGEAELPEETLLKYTEFLKSVIENQTQKEKIELVKKIEETANKIQENIANINNIVIVYVKIDTNDYTISFVDANGQPNSGHGAQNTLAKMSIINAIIKLSNIKQNKEYPFIADAPTSDFAFEFTSRFFESLSNTYKQSIIMTKDLMTEIDNYRNKNFVKTVYEICKNSSEEIALTTNSITVIK